MAEKGGLSNVVLKPGANAEVVQQAAPSATVTTSKLPHPKEPTEHDILLSKGVVVPVIIEGEVLHFTVRPFKFSQFEDVIRATAPLFETLKKGVAGNREAALNLAKDNEKLANFIIENRAHIANFLKAFVPGITEEQINDLHADGIADLTITAVQVNLDFFIQRLAPSLTENLKTLLLQVIPKLGSMPSTR